MYYLVCEGSCNPGVNTLDAAVRKAGRTEIGKVGKVIKSQTNASDDTLAKLRELKHTPHEAAPALPGDGDLFACTVCGKVRRFGL